MKICPVCHIEYDDSAEFCAKCKAHLVKREDESKDAPFDKKGLIKAIAGTLAFIAAIAGLYYLYSVLFLK